MRSSSIRVKVRVRVEMVDRVIKMWANNEVIKNLSLINGYIRDYICVRFRGCIPPGPS